jgi:hypothetical protein
MQKYFDNVTNRGGAAVPSASVLVKTLAGATATIYSDNGTTVAANPITCDGSGYFEFYAADGRYSLTISGKGITTRTVTDILLEDPVDDEIYAVGGAALIGFTAAGGVAAANVQAAIEELDAEKASTASLAAPTGAALVGWKAPFASTIARTLDDRMKDLVCVFEWFTAGEIADWRTGAATLDVTSKIASGLSESSYGVWLPDGAGLITSLTVPTGKALVGSGSKRVTLKQKASTTGTAVIVQSTSQSCTVVGFAIDGNKANQTAANKGFALVSAGSPPSGTNYPGGNHRFDDIYAYKCKGRGIDLDGPGGVLSVGRLYTYQCDLDGIYINVQDSMFDELDAGDSGEHGVYIGTGGYNNRISKAKAWYSGQVDSVTSGDGIYCRGWYNQIGVVELQDCGRHGVHFNAASNNIFSAVHVESAGRVSAVGYGLVLDDSRSNVVNAQMANRTSNVGFLACAHFVLGGSGAFYNNVVITKTAALVDVVFDDAPFHPARNYILINNITNDDGPRLLCNLSSAYKLNMIGATAQVVVDSGGSTVGTKWRIIPNGNDSVVLGYSTVGLIHFSGSHAANPGWTTQTFGGGVAGAKWRLQNVNASNTATIIEASESGGVRALGFFGTSAIGRPTVSAAATDAATTQTLANSLRTALLNLGLAV